MNCDNGLVPNKIELINRKPSLGMDPNLIGVNQRAHYTVTCIQLHECCSKPIRSRSNTTVTIARDIN